MAVTRADVAKMAGVSPAVVSYVLNPGTRPVSAAARARVEKAIETLGYRPNKIAQALRRSSTMSIGLMVPDLANPAISAIAHAIEDIAYDLGYVLFVGTVGTDATREERYLRTYVDRQVDALVILRAHDAALVAKVVGSSMPVVVIDRIEPGLGISSVAPESRESAEQIVTHLIETHGHSRIACISGPRQSTGTPADLVDGWRAALDRAGLPADESLIAYTDQISRNSGYAATNSLLDSVEPTAIFTSADVQATGSISAVRERDLLVPADVAIVSYDGTELAARAFPGLTTVGSDAQEIASVTMTRIVEKLEGRSKPSTDAEDGEPAAFDPTSDETHDIVGTRLTVRRTCGCETPRVALTL